MEPARRHRVAKAAAVAAVAFVVALYAWPGPVGFPQTVAYYAVAVGTMAGAALACGWRARRSAGPDRLAWALLCAAVALWAVGEAGWAHFEVVLRAQVPSPVWMDVPYLLFAPLAIAGILSFGWRPGSGRETAVRLLDALLTTLALFLFSWVAFLREAVAGASGGALAQGVTILYPAMDLALVTALAIMAVRLPPGGRFGLGLLLAGLGLMTVADLGYTWIYLATGGYSVSGFDPLWPAAAAAILAAALGETRFAMTRAGPASWVEQVIPYAAIVPAATVMAWDIGRTGRMDGLTLAFSLVWLMALVARQALFTDAQVRLTRLLHAAQRTAGLGTWEWDRRTGALVVTDGSAPLLGAEATAGSISLAALLGQVDAGQRPSLQASWTALTELGQPLDVTVRLPAGPGPERWVHLLAQGGRKVRGTVQDVTTQMRLFQEGREAARRDAELQRLSEVNRFKTQFINMAAHELNTPLTPIRLSLANLKSAADRGAPSERPLALLERNVERLTRLLHDVLESARLQADRLRLEPAALDLAALVREAVEEYRPVAASRRQQLEGPGPGEAPVLGDAARLHEVVGNLLSNAVKFTPDGGRISVTVHLDGDGVLVAVKDSGDGITAEDLGRLFQPFSQVGASAARRGTGLGLYISRGIVEQHHGRLWAESDGPGQGSTFAFELPVLALRFEAAPAP